MDKCTKTFTLPSPENSGDKLALSSANSHSSVSQWVPEENVNFLILLHRKTFFINNLYIVTVIFIKFLVLTFDIFSKRGKCEMTVDILKEGLFRDFC